MFTSSEPLELLANCIWKASWLWVPLYRVRFTTSFASHVPVVDQDIEMLASSYPDISREMVSTLGLHWSTWQPLEMSQSAVGLLHSVMATQLSE